ncbi:MAG: hypothetical protein JSU65_12280, partial [Candidatus Zixiibacteriota bacterium]
VTDTRTLGEVVILEEEPELEIPKDTLGTDSAWLIDHQPDSVLVGVTCAANKIMVLTDVYYDAWKVYIDGVPGRLLRSYGALRAVEIPAGSRQVLFKFESERYRTGRLVTVLTMLFLVAIIGGHGLRARVWRNKKAG